MCVYVDPTNGDDENDGLTKETPKKTLHAAREISAGRWVMRAFHAPPTFVHCWVDDPSEIHPNRLAIRVLCAERTTKKVGR